jgi:O-antigen/teichoic acid export membrane protein
MRKLFLINILLLILVNVLIKPFFIFGIDLTVQNRTESGAYGLYFALLNWAYLFQIISDFGLQNFNARHVSSASHLLEKYFPSLLVIKVFLSFVYFFIAMAAAYYIGNYHNEALWLLAVLLANQIMVQMTLFLRTNISGLGHYKIDSLLSSLDKLLMLFFCGFALWWHDRTSTGVFPIIWFVLAQSLALLITMFVVYGVLRSKSQIPLRPKLLTNLKTGWPVILVLFKKSLPFAVVILLMSAYTRLDAIILERILPDGDYHTDIFAGSYRLLDALNMFGYLFASLLLPMFSRQLAEGSDVRPLTLLSFRLIWAGSITACVSIYFHRQDIIALMFHGKADIVYRSDVCGVLIWSFVAICVTYIFSTLLTAGAKMRSMNQIFLAGLCLDLILDFTLIPTQKAIGAAHAALCTQVFVALGMVFLCFKYYKLQFTRTGFARITCFSLGITLISWYFVRLEGVAWHIQFIANLLSGLVLAFITGLIDLRPVLELLKKNQA